MAPSLLPVVARAQVCARARVRLSGLLSTARRRRARSARRRRRRARRAPAPRRRALLQRPRTCAETISGSVESGRPTPTRTRAKSGEPRPRRRDFRPLWPASPPPVRVRTSPKGRSISSCSDEHAVELEVQRAARRAGRVAGLVHEGLGRQHGDARAAGPGAAVGEEPGVLLLGARQLPAARELLGHREADVVRRARVALARVAEPDDEPVDRSRARAEEPAHAAALLGALAGGVVAARVALVLALFGRGRLALADELGLLLERGLLVEGVEVGLELGRGQGGDDGLVGVVEDRDTRPAR